jgi:Cu-processing system permease protein
VSTPQSPNEIPSRQTPIKNQSAIRDRRIGNSTLLLFARQEMLLATRSRWTQLFAVVFGGLAIAVASSGYIFSGGSGIQDFSRTAASLMQLVLLLVPLTSLVMGVLALTPERGGAEMLFAQPIARRTVLFGTLLGLFEALITAQAIGFGAAGLLIFARTGDGDFGGFAAVVLGSVALTAVSLAIAAALAAGQFGRRRVRALAAALITWFSLALLFDVVVLGAASLLRSGHASRLLIISILVNPVDAVRTGTLLAVEGTAAFGPASLALLRFTGGMAGAAVLIGLSIAVWVAAPLTWAVRRLSAVDIA